MQRFTNTSRVPFQQRVSCTIPEACQAIGLGRTKLYELIGGGALQTITIGRRRLVIIDSLLALVPHADTAGKVGKLAGIAEFTNRDRD